MRPGTRWSGGSWAAETRPRCLWWACHAAAAAWWKPSWMPTRRLGARGRTARWRPSCPGCSRRCSRALGCRRSPRCAAGPGGREGACEGGGIPARHMHRRSARGGQARRAAPPSLRNCMASRTCVKAQAFRELGDEYCRLLRQRVPETQGDVIRVVDKMLFNSWCGRPARQGGRSHMRSCRQGLLCGRMSLLPPRSPAVSPTNPHSGRWDSSP